MVPMKLSGLRAAAQNARSPETLWWRRGGENDLQDKVGSSNQYPDIRNQDCIRML